MMQMTLNRRLGHKPCIICCMLICLSLGAVTSMFLGVFAINADAVVVAGDALAVAFAVELEAFAVDAFAG